MAQKEFRPFWSERYWNIHNWRDTGTLQEADTRWNLWRYADAIDSIVAFRHCAYGFLPLTFDSSQDVHSQALLGFHMFLFCIYGVSMHIVIGLVCLVCFGENFVLCFFVFCQFFKASPFQNWYQIGSSQLELRSEDVRGFESHFTFQGWSTYTSLHGKNKNSTTISRKKSKNKKTAFAWHFDDCEIWDHVRSIGTVGIAGRWICRSAFLIPWALFRSWVRCNISYCDFYFVQCHQDKFMFFLIFYT